MEKCSVACWKEVGGSHAWVEKLLPSLLHLIVMFSCTLCCYIVSSIFIYCEENLFQQCWILGEQLRKWFASFFFISVPLESFFAFQILSWIKLTIFSPLFQLLVYSFLISFLLPPFVWFPPTGRCAHSSSR